MELPSSMRASVMAGHARIALVRLRSQQMIRICHERCDGVGLGCVVVAANLTVPIHQNHARAVHWVASVAAVLGRRELEPMRGQIVNR